MPRREFNFFGPAALTASAATKFTSPAAGSGVYVITHVHVVNTDSVGRSFTASIGSDAAGTELWATEPLAAKGSAGDAADYYGEWVMPAATVFQAFASSASVVTMEVNGHIDYEG